MATTVSSMVAGSRWARSSRIGRRVKRLVPMSPRAPKSAPTRKRYRLPRVPMSPRAPEWLAQQQDTSGDENENSRQ